MNLGNSMTLKPISCFIKASLSWFNHSFHILLFQLNPFWFELSYFITLSLIGFLALKASKTRTSFVPKDIDFFFTSVSAATVSSMSTVEIEVFSNTQLIFLTILMFLGGEVFTSMLRLILMRPKMEPHSIEPACSIELSANYLDIDYTKPETEEEKEGSSIKLKSIKTLGYLVSCYLFLIHAVGSASISIYLSFVESARKVLKRKHVNLQTFSIFTTVSTFANCGFIPTNENMVVFKNNSGLLLILLPQLVMGNTLYPVFLRLSIWLMGKMTKRGEFRYMLKNSRELGYDHLFSGCRTVCLTITVLGFVVLQLVILCSLDWGSEELNGGLNGYQKVVGSVFQVVNSRHAGESVFDLSAISPATLVLFVFMMYLPPYTSFLPIEEAKSISKIGGKNTAKNKCFLDHILFSQLTYLLVFIILVCITERQKMKTDPLNFSLLNIVVEVISAYGNVGFTAGYSCGRQISTDGHCKDAWSGFAGRWSNGGKLVLIMVMFFGRLKKFSKRGGRAWILA